MYCLNLEKKVKYLVTLVLNKIEPTLPLLIWTFVLKNRTFSSIFLQILTDKEELNDSDRFCINDNWYGI